MTDLDSGQNTQIRNPKVYDQVNALYNCLSAEDSLKNKKIQILCAMVGF